MLKVDPAEGAPWFVMPLYRPMWRREGGYVEDYRGNIPRVLEIATGLATALSFMHAVDQTHRDVKGSNVFFREPGGPPLLGDFGIAYDPTQAEQVTELGERLGPYWRAPELRGGSIHQRHSGSDIYALGGLIYEALSGGRSFEEAEQVDGQYTHELPEYSLVNVTDDARVPYVNQMLRNMFRRRPDNRLSANDVIALTRQIREWNPGQPPPESGQGISEAATAVLNMSDVRSV